MANSLQLPTPTSAEVPLPCLLPDRYLIDTPWSTTWPWTVVGIFTFLARKDATAFANSLYCCCLAAQRCMGFQPWNWNRPLEPKTKTKRMGIANTSSTVLGILQLVIRKKRSSAVRNVVTVTLSYFPSLKYHIKTHVDVVTWRPRRCHTITFCGSFDTLNRLAVMSNKMRVFRVNFFLYSGAFS